MHYLTVYDSRSLTQFQMMLIVSRDFGIRNLNFCIIFCISPDTIDHVIYRNHMESHQESWNQAKIPKKFRITLTKILSVRPLGMT